MIPRNKQRPKRPTGMTDKMNGTQVETSDELSKILGLHPSCAACCCIG
jgi:hypothetical protein